MNHIKCIIPKNHLLLFYLAFFLIAGICACNGKSNQTAETDRTSEKSDTNNRKTIRNVTFLPYWVASAQFAGYYVAKEMGIYKKYGINLDIIPYEASISNTDLIKKGKFDFAALWLTNALELKSSGADIVNIAQLSSRSSLMLLAKKKSGINTLKDMNGKKVGIWKGFELQPQVLFKKYQLNVTSVPIGSTNNLFLMDGVDITNANWFDEYHTIINSGLDPDEINTFFFADYDLNFLEDGIYCSADKLNKDPQLCADFVNATLEGWMYAFNNQEMAVDIVQRYAEKDKVPVNKTHQYWMLERYKDLYIPKGKALINTSLSAKDYLFVGNILKEYGLINEVYPFDLFYKPVTKK